MQFNGKNRQSKHLDFMLIDLAALLFSFFTAYFIKYSNLYISSKWIRFILIVVFINIAFTLVGNPYRGIFRRRYYREIGTAFLMVFSNAMCTILILYFLKLSAEYSREIIINTFVFYYFISVVFKYIWKKLLYSGRIRINTPKKTSLLLVCSDKDAERSIHSVYSTDVTIYDIKAIYKVTDNDKISKSDTIQFISKDRLTEIPVIRHDIVNYVLDNDIDEILVSVCPDAGLSACLQDLVAHGVAVNLSIDHLLGFQSEQQVIDNIGVNKTLSVGSFTFSPEQRVYLVIKRFFDIIIGSIGIVILLPLAGLIKAAYLLSGDTSKILFRQERVGLNGKTIKIWKFRSMVPDAEKILDELLKEEKYRKEWEENQKLEDDPRITKIGRILRKTSIDELPQMINVFTGDMSLVGPRPLVSGELSFHNGLKLYEKVKPGITGWWGCNGRSSIDYNERLELEYYYVKNCSFYLDCLCIVRTLFSVLNMDGVQ